MGRPVDQIAAGMDGRVRSTTDTPAWLRDQLLTAEQSLRTVTLDAAHVLGDETRRGHLAPGTLGDVTILSGDVTAATPDEIRAMSVVATIIGGIPAFCADPAICSVPDRPTTAPSAAADAGLPVGGSHVLVSDGSVEMTVTIPAPGWTGDEAGGILVKNDNVDAPDGAGMIVFPDDGLFVYGDPCKWASTTPATPATTVDAVVAALAAQASRDASEPVDITVDGHTGKSITLHVPDDADFSTCDQGFFGSWGVASEPTPGRYHQDPGQIDEVWVLDVAGQLLVIDTTYYAGTPAEHVAEIRAIVESATFGSN